MPHINKPRFPHVSTGDLEKKLEQLGKEIDKATGADGAVDVAKVEDAVSNDPALRDAFDEVKDTFQRREMRDVRTGCGGGTERREVQVDPTTLNAAEVRSVMSALLDAKSRVSSALDKNSDGVLQRDELARPDAGSDLAAALVEQVAKNATPEWKEELRGWQEAITAAVQKAENRQHTDTRIGEIADKHAETPLGKEAITWAYREVLASGRGVDTWHMDDQLEGAERSFLRHLPLFGGLVTGKGHLSDDEVMRFLSTTDLREFIADKKQAITAKVGGDYESFWLEGGDIPGADQKSDPDFRRVSTGC